MGEFLFFNFLLVPSRVARFFEFRVLPQSTDAALNNIAQMKIISNLVVTDVTFDLGHIFKNDENDVDDNWKLTNDECDKYCTNDFKLNNDDFIEVDKVDDELIWKVNWWRFNFLLDFTFKISLDFLFKIWWEVTSTLLLLPFEAHSRSILFFYFLQVEVIVVVVSSTTRNKSNKTFSL